MKDVKFQVITDPPRYMAEQWPSTFIVIPRVGELVAATSGFTMKVDSLVHSQEGRVPDAAADCFLIIVYLKQK